MTAIQQADRLINKIREEIKEVLPELSPDEMNEMVLKVIRKARRMIEQQNKKA